MPEDDLRALVFSCLVFMNMGLILVNRSFNASLVTAFLRPNRSLWILLSSVSVVLIIAIYWNPARQLFHFGQLHLMDFSICIIVGILGLLILEGLKSLWFPLNSSK
jgi:Ca2+-transporting ATPase